ncbi:MAG: GNAT family N-acetyltransferase [Rhizobiaceae bacterium]|nr:GNAT family N-acetyltransferase [Rhizobiaceae bacterium]
MADIAFREDALSAPRILRRRSCVISGARWDFRVDSELNAYDRASQFAIFAPPQSPEWVEAWVEAGSELVIPRIHASDGSCVLALALETTRRRGLRIARFVGNRHSNANFPMCSYSAIERIKPELLQALFEAISALRPDIDLLTFERMSWARAGKRNPFAEIEHRPSADITLATDLSAGFDAVVARTGGSSKLKKYRRQVRKFNETGDVRIFTATTPAEIERILNEFLTMKAQRFAAQGIADPFAPDTVQLAFRKLFRDAPHGQIKLFTLDAIEIGGKIRAIAGHSHDGDRLICDFCAFSNDELSAHSPGSFLFFETIRKAAEQGYRIYDFSVGDEPYKRHWADIETELFDVVVPLNMKGRIAATGLQASYSAKRWLKSQPRLWDQAKRMRKLLRGKK